MTESGQQTKATHKYVDEQDVTLREYLEALIRNLEKSFLAHYEAQEKALITALAANEKRLDSMNEFRETLRDQNKTFATFSEQKSFEKSVNEKFETMNESIKAIQISDAVLVGKASQLQFYIVMVVSVIGLIVSIVRMVAQ